MPVLVKDANGAVVQVATNDDVIVAMTALMNALDADLLSKLDELIAVDTVYSFDVSVAPATTAGAYGAGDIMGGLLTLPVAFANDGKVCITGVEVTLKSNVNPTLVLVLLNADPTSTARADNDNYNLNAADAFKIIGTVAMGTGWVDHGTVQSVTVEGVDMVVTASAGTKNVFGLLIDYTGVVLGSVADLQVRVRGIGA